MAGGGKRNFRISNTSIINKILTENQTIFGGPYAE
jgi:hypothetical protein